jgi:hypothetical protein
METTDHVRKIDKSGRNLFRESGRAEEEIY